MGFTVARIGIMSAAKSRAEANIIACSVMKPELTLSGYCKINTKVETATKTVSPREILNTFVREVEEKEGIEKSTNGGMQAHKASLRIKAKYSLQPTSDSTLQGVKI